MEKLAAQRKQGLAELGLEHAETVRWNLRAPQLYEATVREGTGRIARNGPLVVDTRPYTGRSPKDKFVVRDPEVRDRVVSERPRP